MDRGGSVTIGGAGGLISLDWMDYLNNSNPRHVGNTRSRRGEAMKRSMIALVVVMMLVSSVASAGLYTSLRYAGTFNPKELAVDTP